MSYGCTCHCRPPSEYKTKNLINLLSVFYLKRRLCLILFIDFFINSIYFFLYFLFYFFVIIFIYFIYIIYLLTLFYLFHLQAQYLALLNFIRTTSLGGILESQGLESQFKALLLTPPPTVDPNKKIEVVEIKAADKKNTKRELSAKPTGVSTEIKVNPCSGYFVDEIKNEL